MRSSGVERRGTVGDDRFFAVGRGFQPRLRLGEGRSELNPRVVGKRSGREGGFKRSEGGGKRSGEGGRSGRAAI